VGLAEEPHPHALPQRRAALEPLVKVLLVEPLPGVRIGTALVEAVAVELVQAVTIWAMVTVVPGWATSIELVLRSTTLEAEAEAQVLTQAIKAPVCPVAGMVGPFLPTALLERQTLVEAAEAAGRVTALLAVQAALAS